MKTQHRYQQTEEIHSRCLTMDSFLSLSCVGMKAQGCILSMLSFKFLIDVKWFQWKWVGLITITEETLHASCYPKFLRPEQFQFHLCYSKSNLLLVFYAFLQR